MDYISLNQYCKNKFGRKLYKISIDGGFTCPNRDGKLDTRGCIFCSGRGSGDFAESRLLPIYEQIEKGKERVLSKMPRGENHQFIAYFQAFTNTYGEIEDLRAKFTEAIKHKDIAALSIATRPDCLGEEVITLLAELNRVKPVWVELGLQSIHEKTARYIRRGYPLSRYDKAMRLLNQVNLEVIVHVILGLPYESREEMLETVRYVARSGAKGIKLQLLHVLKGTDLAGDYEKGLFQCLTMDEYVKLVADCVEVLPKDMVVHRLTGDGDKRSLLAPMWSCDKKRVLNAISREIRER